MNKLLDSCVMSEFMKKTPNQKIVDWMAGQIEESLFISVITIGESEKGIYKLPISRRKAILTNWVEDMIRRFGRRVLPIDTAIMRRWGKLVAELEAKGRVLPGMDSLIAVTALEHDLTIITRNERDFADTGAKILNIWK